jgi:hypothetical protein
MRVNLSPACEPTPRADDEPVEMPPRLHCEGGQLVKPNGQPIFLRGVSFGSWGEDDPVDCPQIKRMGSNLVRIALRWHGEYGNDPATDSRDDKAYAFLRRGNVSHWLDLISAASAAGLWVVPFIDSNCLQSGTQDAAQQAYCDPYGSFGARGRNGYTDASLRRLFTSIVWPAAAARLRVIPRIAMLEIHPEPAIDRGPEYAPLVTQLHRECIAAIREVDADTPFLIGARSSYDIELVDESYLAERTDCVYTGNLLSGWVTNPERFDRGLAALTNFRENTGAPIFVQQLGRKSGDDPGLAFMRRAVEAMRREDVGYAWWQWRQNTSNPEQYALNYKSPDGAGWIAKQAELELLAAEWSGVA